MEQWLAKNRDRLRADYFDFLRFRSISADPSCRAEVERCAQWVAAYLDRSGVPSELLRMEGGHPVVFGKRDGGRKPTLLIYGHYDVQPVDPLELWESDPFLPEERDGKVFARGAVDDKGQIFYAMAAVRALQESGIELPVNLLFCIEGEEESGSKALSQLLTRDPSRWKSDYLLVVDYDMLDEHTPAITLGSRGIVTMEVRLTGSHSDLHSGVLGGIAYNPNRALVELLADMWDRTGRVQVPGFYDQIEEIEPSALSPFSYRWTEEAIAQEFGIRALGGEAGRSLIEKNWLRPTLEINGLSGGYAGSGFKTVIPKEAIAKLSCRLVPGQHPEAIARQIERFCQTRAPQGMRVSVSIDHGGKPYRGNPHSPLAQAAKKAYEDVMGASCQMVLSGASVPIVADVVEAAGGAEVVGMGYGLPTDAIHAPNEHFSFSRLEKGLLTVARLVHELGRYQKSGIST
jgi:acetylornithine deacetylase/succinyl-diaminopimelate desuccinylase-like protein